MEMVLTCFKALSCCLMEDTAGRTRVHDCDLMALLHLFDAATMHHPRSRTGLTVNAAPSPRLRDTLMTDYPFDNARKL